MQHIVEVTPISLAAFIMLTTNFEIEPYCNAEYAVEVPPISLVVQCSLAVFREPQYSMQRIPVELTLISLAALILIV